MRLTNRQEAQAVKQPIPAAGTLSAVQERVKEYFASDDPAVKQVWKQSKDDLTGKSSLLCQQAKGSHPHTKIALCALALMACMGGCLFTI